MLIYIAGKYSGDTPDDVASNIAHAASVKRLLLEIGHDVICPHLNSTHAEIQSSKTLGYDEYMREDFAIIRRCDALMMLKEWEQSAGAVREGKLALDLGIPIFYEEDGLPRLHKTEQRAPEQCRAFVDTIMRMYRTHLDKNADYSPNNIVGTGDMGVIVRMWDKMARLMALRGFAFTIDPQSVRFTQPSSPKNESVDDSILDIAVYAVIFNLLRQNRWGI